MAPLATDAIKDGSNFITWGLNFFCNRGDYFVHLQANNSSLKNETDCLTKLKYTIGIACKGRPYTQQLNRDMTRWLQRVESCLKTASTRIEEAEDEINNKCWRWFCPKHCCSFNALETEVSKILDQIKSEIKEGHRLEDELAEMPSEERPTVGLHSVVKQVLGYIKNPSIQIIGLYDMEGSAKPKQMIKVIKPKLVPLFDVVISVNVAIEANILQVQDAIIRKIKLSNDLWENKSEGERSLVIQNFLGTKTFVLVLDGLTERWKLSDLLKLGVPLENRNEKKSKIILTASTEKVFQQMEVDVLVEIDFLPPKDARKLSKQLVEPVLPVPDMSSLAAVSEGPIAVGIPIIYWVIPQELQHARGNKPWPKVKFVKTRKHLIEHSPY